MITNRAHRPHCLSHDYYERGIYLITMVVNNQERTLYRQGAAVLGRLRKEANLSEVHGQDLVELTSVGQSVLDCWKRIPEEQAKKGVHVRLMDAVVMPDHFHGILFVEEKSPISVGQMIWGMKVGCTKAYRPCQEPYLAPQIRPCQEPYLAPLPNLHNMSRAQRATYKSLFEDNYDDTILVHKGQLKAMREYVMDNPRRAILRLLYADFYQRRLHIWLNGIDKIGQPTRREYAAFGNLFLLRYPWKEQVMCHRWKMHGLRRDYNTPYVETEDYQRQHDELMTAAENGAVLVTPGISLGEARIKKEAIDREFPLILLQKEPIDSHWKPEKERFQACKEGKLLILAPWHIDQMATCTRIINDHTEEDVPANTDYSQFHNMNDLAAEICRWSGGAKLRFE